MANRLKMAISEAILRLHERRWSGRRIALELGIDGETVARHVALAVESKPAKAPIGSVDAAVQSKPAKAPIGSGPSVAHGGMAVAALELSAEQQDSQTVAGVNRSEVP